MTVAWGDSSNEYKYIVSRDTGTGFADYITLVAGTVGFTDPDTGYNKHANSVGYKVRSCKDSGCTESVYAANEATAVCPVLNPPTNVTASCTQPGGPVAVSWVDSSNE